MKAAPAWVNRQLFPFESKWITIEGSDIHYVDEGSGDVIVFAHGTPEWSFGYRDLIRELRSEFRCIAMDMLGFGLSDKPLNADYTCQAHARRLDEFIKRLELKNITIVANDFGGGISMSYALNNPGNIRNIFLFNTWMRSLKSDPHYAGPAKWLDTWFGRLMYLRFNAPVNVIMPSAFGNKKLLTREVHRHYKNALPAGNRVAAYAFAKELMNASEWWHSMWQRVDELDQNTISFFWGLKDKFIPPSELELWKAKLPHASVVTFNDAGHFVQEEKPMEMSVAIRKKETAGRFEIVTS